MSMIFVQPRRAGKSCMPLLVYAAQNGWSVARSQGGHLRFSKPGKPGKPAMFTSSTPSDSRAVLARLIRFDRMEANHA